MKRYLILLIVLGSVLSSRAQQQATYTQYMFNGMSINPGYIGSHDALSISALGRWQWVGIEGAPNTQTLAAHTPIPGKNIGVGFQITRDQLAVSSITDVMFGYSYQIPVGGGFLSMGMQGGFQSYRANLSEVYTIGSDPTFDENFSSTKPNVGVGTFYYTSRFYVGFSAPLLINNKVRNGDLNVYSQERHYFLNGGAVFELSPKVSVKPNFLAKFVGGAPVSIDYNVNFLLNDLIWVGFSYRPPESIAGLIELNVNQRLRVGYAYDYIIDQALSEATSSSHEILINYRIKLSKDKIVNPRFL